MQSQIDRQLHGFPAPAQGVVEPALEPGLAVIIDTGKPDNMGQQRAIRVDAPFFMLKLQAGQTELIDSVGLLRGQMPLDPDKAFARGQLGQYRIVVEAGQCRDELLRGISGVEDLPRIGVKRWGVEGRGQQLAVTVDNVGALERGWRLSDRTVRSAGR